jgi:hypothetical protein
MGQIGHGTTVSFEKSSFSATLRSLTGPSISITPVDASHMGSTYRTMQFVPGMMDPGEVTMELIFDPDELSSSGHEPFSEKYMTSGWDIDAASEEVEALTITWPVPAGDSSGATWVADGFISGFEPTAPIDDLMTATVTFKISGDITYTAAS